LHPESIELISDDGETQTWLLHNYYTGNYLTGGAVSSNGTPFYILSVDYNPVATGPGARFILDYANPELDKTVCYKPTAKAWIYNAIAGGDVEIVISREPCPIWEIISSWGTIVEATATTITLDATDIGGGAWRIWFKTIDGLVFHTNTVTGEAGYPGFSSYYNAAGTLVSGYPPINTNIQGAQMGASVPFSITLTGYIV